MDHALGIYGLIFLAVMLPAVYWVLILGIVWVIRGFMDNFWPLYEHQSIKDGDMLPNATICLVDLPSRFCLCEIITLPSGYLKSVYHFYQRTGLIINIPIPFAFWHYSPQYFDAQYAYWSLSLRIIRDDAPIMDGNLPRIGLNSCLIWRKEACRPTMKTMSR